MTLKPADCKYRRNEGTSLEDIGPVYADIELLNYADLVLNRHGHRADTDIRRIKRRALVNSGAWDLIINREIKEQLDLRVFEVRTVRFPDESLREVEIVGPVEVRFENHDATVTAIILPEAEEVLLGRLPLAALNVFIDRESKQLLGIPYTSIKRVA